MKGKKEVESTFFYIKPDSMSKADDILADIKKAGFIISYLKTVKLTISMIDHLYSYLNRKRGLRRITHEQMVGKFVLIGIATKVNAFQEFVDLCGVDFDPDKCKENTLRKKYATKKPIYAGGNKYYYPNVIHRSKNVMEYLFNILIFYRKEELKHLFKAEFSEIFIINSIIKNKVEKILSNRR